MRKEIFIIRHGQSKWNEGQSNRNVKELVGQVDHELTKLGIEQAQNFNKRWKEEKNIMKVKIFSISFLVRRYFHLP